MKKYEIDLKGEGDYYKVSKSEYEKFPGHKRIVGHEVKGNEPTDWKESFTYFLEHLITNDKEKINLIVAEVERIAGSKGEPTFSYGQLYEAVNRYYGSDYPMPHNTLKLFIKEHFGIDLNEGIAGSKKEETNANRE